MTTNVFCRKSNVLASDSRWSYKIIDEFAIPSARAVAYVDDTGFDKIAFDEDTGFLFAGPGDVIERWRQWVEAKSPVMKRPDVAPNFAVCMTDLDSVEILFEHGQKVQDEHCRTAGTGAKPAYDCWVVNADAQRAVTSAIGRDLLSGGSVKFLNGTDRTHNVNPTVDFASVATAFLAKGMVMYPATPKAVPLEQAAKEDPRIAQLVAQVKGNQLSAEAPSGYDPVVWTPADEARLDEALAKRAAKRASKMRAG